MNTKENLKNIKLFPIYKLFAYDLLFYYAIQMLFLHNVKGISISNIVLLNSLYSAFQMVFQIPASLVVDKLGYKKCIITGNIFCTTAVITYIISNSFGTVMLGDFQLALGFALKSVSESPFLFTTMKREKMEKNSAKIEAKGSSFYFYTEAFASIISGYLYVLNPYIPVALCALAMLTSTVISIKFNDIPISSNQKEKLSKKDYFSDMKNGFKFIFKSHRLKALLIFSCAFAGIMAVASNFSKAFMTDIGISSVTFGIITSALSVISAIGSSYQDKFESKRKKKTLSYISIIYTVVFIFVGIPHLIGFNTEILLSIGFVVFALQNFFKGSYRVIMKKYLNNFTTSSIRPKIMSVYYLSEMFGTAVLLFLASKMLDLVNIGIAYIVFGVLFIMLMLLILEYMSTRLGLKPEQYNEKDIKFNG